MMMTPDDILRIIRETATAMVTPAPAHRSAKGPDVGDIHSWGVQGGR